jgi:hypothetical protein
MNRQRNLAEDTQQTRMSASLTTADSVWLFAPLLIFLALLARETWEFRLVHPMALALLGVVISAGLVLVLAGIWSCRPWRIASTSTISLKPRHDPVTVHIRAERKRDKWNSALQLPRSRPLG